MKTLLAISTSEEINQLLTVMLGSEYDIIISATVQDGIALLDHVQPDIFLLEHPCRMQLLYEIHARVARMHIIVLTGRNAWPEAIREITAHNVRSNYSIRHDSTLTEEEGSV